MISLGRRKSVNGRRAN